MTITAKYKGTCTVCNNPIAVGEQIEWKKGSGSTHAECTSTAAVAPSAGKFPPTPEQQQAIVAAKTGESLAVQAGAGTGKTSTLVLIAEALAPKRGQFLTFTRPTVEDAKLRFPRNVRCNTAHSLAFKAVGHRYSHRLDGDRMKTSEIAARLRIRDLRFQNAGVIGAPKNLSATKLAGLVVKTVDRFCQSADSDLAAVHVPFIAGLDAPGSYVNNNEVTRVLLPFARRMWDDIQNVDGVLRFTPSHYLKMWQLNDPIIATDFILFDEAQDANPVMVAIVSAQGVERRLPNGTVLAPAQLIWVGDSQQQIYSFTGAINALETVPHEQETFLTQSFRFGPAVAEVANRCLARLNAPLRITGWDKIESTVAPIIGPDAILCRTNATAVEEFIKALDEGVAAHIVGGAKELLWFAEAALDLQDGRSTSHPELAIFNSWEEVQQYVSEDEQGGDLKLLVNLVDGFGALVILTALEQMPSEANADLVISTAHKAKGREWDRVRIAGDFPDQAEDEELRLLYVAVTRARLVLDITQAQGLAA